MKPAPFEYHAPAAVDEAVSLLAEFAEQGGRIIAGGQSLVPMMAFRLARPSHLIDINGIADLNQLSVEDGALRIGATVRHAMVETTTIGGTLGRLLRDVARFVAHPPIRNRGTFCGSLAHADPSAEYCLVAATLDAVIVVRSGRGIRLVPASEFFVGIMTTSIATDELITECRIPLLAEDAQFGFYEVSRRAGDFAMAAALVTYRLHHGRIADARIGIGGVEMAPRRLLNVEEMLAGALPGTESFRAAAELAANSVRPMEDNHITKNFRRQLACTVILRALGRSLP
jgi:aerobic carbon-monoxide dehydrogenase medium subunit